jgi:hypothetical protein
MLINSNFTATHLWNQITLRNSEDGDDMFTETSVRARATRYKVPEVIYTLRITSRLAAAAAAAAAAAFSVVMEP